MKGANPEMWPKNKQEWTYDTLQSDKFIDLYPTFDIFLADWRDNLFFDESIAEDELKLVYAMLVAKYADRYFNTIDPVRNSLRTMEIIKHYYPNLVKRLALLKQIQDAQVEELINSTNIRNFAQGDENDEDFNDKQSGIQHLTSQNITFSKNPLIQGLLAKYNAVVDGLHDDFINRFQNIFLKFDIGGRPYRFKELL